MSQSFGTIVDLAMQTPGYDAMRPVVEKELLHYDLLFALERGGFLKNMVFQGGTSLRLCHGAPRFSEDLDFVGGVDFTSSKLFQMADMLHDYLSKRYGLEVFVKSPKELKDVPEYAGTKVDKWQISVVTQPERPDLPRQRIKLEVANLPAHTSELRGLRRNYDFLPDGYEDVLIKAETKEEIMADKLVAFPVTLPTHVRFRDIWDMRWLGNQGIVANVDLVRKKVEDYGISGFDRLLTDAIDRVQDVVEDPAFFTEMARFVPQSTADQTFNKDGFKEFITRETRELLQGVSKQMAPPKPSAGPSYDF